MQEERKYAIITSIRIKFKIVAIIVIEEESGI